MFSIIGNIGRRSDLIDCFWLVAKHFELLVEYLLDWLSKTLIYCQKTMIYCQNILNNCQKFPTSLITSLKYALDSTLSLVKNLGGHYVNMGIFIPPFECSQIYILVFHRNDAKTTWINFIPYLSKSKYISIHI